MKKVVLTLAGILMVIVGITYKVDNSIENVESSWNEAFNYMIAPSHEITTSNLTTVIDEEQYMQESKDLIWKFLGEFLQLPFEIESNVKLMIAGIILIVAVNATNLFNFMQSFFS